MNTLILYYDTMWGIHTDLTAPKGFEITLDKKRYEQAQVVVFHLPAWKWRRWLGLPKKLPGQLWVAWTLESDVNYPYQRAEDFMSRFDLKMTYHLDSDMPQSYAGFYGGSEKILRVLHQPPQSKLDQPLVAAFISSRFNQSGRLEYLRELMHYLQVDSYGKFMRNKPGQRNSNWHKSKLEIIARYKFTLAFENAIDPDYVTEKFFDPLVAGSIPVYLGAPNVEQFAPGDHSYINVTDFPNPRALADYLTQLARDERAYAEYFAWKQNPFRANFLSMIKLLDTPGQVRLCQIVQARYGFIDVHKSN